MLHSMGCTPHWAAPIIPVTRRHPFPPSCIQTSAAAKGQELLEHQFQWTISLSLCGCMGVKESTRSADSREPLSKHKTGWSVKVKSIFWSSPGTCCLQRSCAGWGTSSHFPESPGSLPSACCHHACPPQDVLIWDSWCLDLEKKKWTSARKGNHHSEISSDGEWPGMEESVSSR